MGKRATFSELGAKLGATVDEKRRQYGPAAARTGEILAVLYPQGVPVHAYADALLIVRTLDKICRLAQRGEDGRDLGGESPWVDVVGYGMIGADKDGG